MQMMITSTPRLLSYPIQIQMKVMVLLYACMFKLSHAHIKCFDILVQNCLHLTTVDDKYDEADLIHLNSEEAIEFSHTSDNLTESHSECNNKKYFTKE